MRFRIGLTGNNFSKKRQNRNAASVILWKRR
jgi:hypothetical protein